MDKDKQSTSYLVMTDEEFESLMQQDQELMEDLRKQEELEQYNILSIDAEE